ncbi:MAG: hypothetical protein C3F07_11775 [Anaerolineales bacterium]|nr:hypothetical protein [Anaerolineae bacterium]PWB72463.1 MAG: hypothetical protein C3F07_11775 [Anaerolineales bacterium]
MAGNFGAYTNLIVLTLVLILPILFIVGISQKWSLVPPPKERDFGSVLAEWAQQRGLQYVPQHVYVVSGVYNNRWFSIGTTNEENALQIRMSVQNPQRTSLQIFGDWLEDSGVLAFVNRFRIYSTPSGLGETLFDTNTRLRDSLLKFPGLRARFDLLSDPKDPNHLHYSLLADLPGVDTLEAIMAALCRFCDDLEKQIARKES